MLKQYLHNHQRYAVKHGHMQSKPDQKQAAANGEQHSNLPDTNVGEDEADEEIDD